MSPLITMSAVTGKPTKTEIFNYIKSLKVNGIDQIMMYPRPGCDLEYMTEEWFERIEWFIEAAQSLDVVLWLYDEYFCPSGDAKGKVSAQPKFRLKAIVTTGENTGEIRELPPQGERFFANVLCEEAVDYFIAYTHEAYKKRFGKYFGSVIRGIFTDEPGLGYCAGEDAIPYYEGLENDYYSACGRDFITDMKTKHSAFYTTAMELIGTQFNRCYIQKITDWCKKNDLIMTGHLMEDNELIEGVRNNGNLLKNLKSFMMPGIDEIWTNFKDERLFNLLGVAAYARNEHGAMAELFALGPCDMTYAKKRCMLFLSACFKINHYFLAISHMDMRGNLKVVNYLSNFASDQPDFSGMRLLTQAAQTAANYADKDYAPEIFVQYPTRIFADHLCDKCDVSLFLELINKLTAHQIQWHYTLEETMGDIPVITFTEQLEPIYKGTVFSEVESLIRTLAGTLKITDEDGCLPEDIFVRSFKDKSLVVLNLSNQEKKCLLDGQKIVLAPYDVYLSQEPTKNTLNLTRQNIEATFKLTYDRLNIIRLMYINEQQYAKLCCQTNQKVKFAIRKGTQVMLKDQIIATPHLAEGLSDGLKNLYNFSDEIILNSGDYILKAHDDFKYLPSVFVQGDFTAVSQAGEVYQVTLSPRQKVYQVGQHLEDFGTVSFTTTLVVPQGVTGLVLGGTTLYTCVWLNEILIGEKIFEPYIYPIDKAHWGQSVSLKITQASSLAPIFGDVAYYDKIVKICNWRGTPHPTPTLFGFESLSWTF